MLPTPGTPSTAGGDRTHGSDRRRAGRLYLDEEDRILPQAATDVRIGGTVFEGHHEFFVGLDQERPFVVERLDDPPRVVVDIFHEAS